jgi:hypothetical protein
MQPPDIERGGPHHKAAPNKSLPTEPVSRTAYRRDSRAASALVVYRLDSKEGRPNPEMWEEAYEARVSLMAQEAAETTRENEYLRSRLALAEDELEMRRKLCRCRRLTK